MALKEKNHSVRRTLWISDELWARMTDAAHRDGRTVSGWVRSRAESALARETVKRVLPSSGRDGGAFRVRD